MICKGINKDNSSFITTDGYALMCNGWPILLKVSKCVQEVYKASVMNIVLLT